MEKTPYLDNYFHNWSHNIFIASNFKLILLDGKWVEFLIPITIGITCVSVLFKQKNKYFKAIWISLITLFFGIIHGFGFGRYFRMISINDDSAAISLLKFAVGVEFCSNNNRFIDAINQFFCYCYTWF